MPPTVLSAVTDYLAEEAAGGAYETELRHADTLEKGVYKAVAQLLDAPVDDVALFDNATRAWCSVIDRLPFKPGDRVWVTPYEYAGNLIALTGLRRRHGLRIEVIPLLPDGELDLDWAADNIREDVALVCVTHVPSGCGIVNPVAQLGRILEPWPCFYAVDACQSAGQLRLSVPDIGCDLLTGAGRKFLCGPRGTAFAFIGRRLRSAAEPPYYDLHVADMVSDDAFEVRSATARVFELAERGNAAVMGFEAALAHHQRRGEDGTSLREAVTAALGALPGIRLIDPGSHHASLVTFTHERVPAARIRQELYARGINVWLIKGSHTPIYMREQGVEHAVRVSPHYYNSATDIDAFAIALRDVLR